MHEEPQVVDGLNPHFVVDVAMPPDEPQVTRLIAECYQHAPQFIVQNRKLLAASLSSQKTMYIILREGEYISSCMSVTSVFGQSEAEAIMECDWDICRNYFPAILLGRAATKASRRRRGFHALLRWAVLSHVDCLPTIHTVLDIVHTSAPQESSMLDIGYIPHRIRSYWYKDIESLSQPWVFALSLSTLRGDQVGPRLIGRRSDFTIAPTLKPALCALNYR